PGSSGSFSGMWIEPFPAGCESSVRSPFGFPDPGPSQCGVLLGTGRSLRAGDLRIADRFAYAPVRGVGRLAADGKIVRGIEGWLKDGLPGCAGSDFPIQAVGFGGGLDAQDDRQELPATPERVERFGLVAGRGKGAHQAAIERLGEVVGFESAPVEVDGTLPVAFRLELLAQTHQRAHEPSAQRVARLGDPRIFVGA